MSRTDNDAPTHSFSQFNKATDKQPASTYTLDQLINSIKYGEHKEQVEKVRNAVTEEEKKKAKMALPAFTISGTFRNRQAEEIIEHSGLLCIDIDEPSQEDRDKLAEDPYVLALFASASGKGLATIHKIPKVPQGGDIEKHHKAAFRWTADRFLQRYGIVVDEAPKSPVSLRSTSYDPEIIVHNEARVVRTKKEPKQPKTLPVVADNDSVEAAIKEAVQRGVDLAPTYDDYLRLGFALAHGFGEAGREHFHNLCQVNEKYRPEQADRKFTHCLKAQTGKITVGTFYHMLQRGGIEVKTDPRPTRAVSVHKMKGRSKDKASESIREAYDIDQEQADHITKEVYERGDITPASVTESQAQMIEAVEEYILSEHRIRYNEARIRFEVQESGRWNDLTDEYIGLIWRDSMKTFDTSKVQRQLVRDICHDPTNKESYNPVRKFVEENRGKENYTPPRDHPSHLDAMVATLKTTQDKTLEPFIRKWMIGIAACSNYDPSPLILTLMGGPNIGKTFWLRNLLPESIQGLYAQQPMSADKDFSMLMCQSLLILFDDIDATTMGDQKRLKSIASQEKFTFRKPYGKDLMDHTRLAALAATTNDDTIITDPTGNRRVIPAWLVGIDQELRDEIDKDALFMELVTRYEQGEEFELTMDESKRLNELSQNYRTIDKEAESIMLVFEALPEGVSPDDWMTATEIKNEVEQRTDQRIDDKKMSSHFGHALRSLFGSPKSKWDGHTTKKKYPVRWNRKEVVKSAESARVNGESKSRKEDDVPF